MTARAGQDWLAANQRFLSIAIAVVGAQLCQHTARAADTDQAERVPAPDDLREQGRAIAQAMPSPPALEVVCTTFGLTGFEREVLLLCAGMELDAAFGAYCGRAQGDVRHAHPTFGLALAALSGAHWSAILPDGPLRYWHLIELAPGGSPSAPLTTRPLRIDERILHGLAGLPHMDERLTSVASPVRSSTSSSHRIRRSPAASSRPGRAMPHGRSRQWLRCTAATS